MKMLAIVLSALITLSIAAGAVAWYAGAWPFAHAGRATAHVDPPGDYYVTLDKLVVMTRGANPAGPSQYLAMDLVFAVDDQAHVERTKAQLPLLRSVALRSLAAYEASQLRQMKVDEIIALLDREYLATYGARSEMPFSRVMIARMMIE